ncbi:MAG: zinc-dependent alcohol dehydrogenase family protein [Deltaproteobacteria bacterium]|nr:zinc-dependent alcohol dehydrogenase family protein [Deltaproteobacteria bacterium]
MKVMLLKRTCPVHEHPLTQTDIPVPEPRQGEVLIRVKACGVCHTDLHSVEGDLQLPTLPLVPGHQVVGRVEKRGPDANRFTHNQRVGVTWFFSSCGSCKFCLRGRENLCGAARFTGFHENGGYAEYMVVPEQSAFPIPESFDDTEATPLLCGGVIGYRALKLSEIKLGGSLGMYGFGNSAHVVIQIAVKRGCRVHVFTRSPNHQDLARQLGAAWVGTSDQLPPDPLDAAIIFAPEGNIIPHALDALDKGGTLVLAGITMTEIPPMDYKLIYGERTMRSVANTTRRDAEELLREAAEVPVKTVVETFPLEDANAVLQMMKESRLRGGAALLV